MRFGFILLSLLGGRGHRREFALRCFTTPSCSRLRFVYSTSAGRVCKKARKEKKREDASFPYHLFSVTVSLQGRENRPVRLLPKESDNFVKVNCSGRKSVGVELFLTFLRHCSRLPVFFPYSQNSVLLLCIVGVAHLSLVRGGEIRSLHPLSETRCPCPHALSLTLEDHTGLAPVPLQRARKETAQMVTLKREGEVACRRLASALEANGALVHDLYAW